MKNILIVHAGPGGILPALIKPNLNSPTVLVTESVCGEGTSSSEAESYGDGMRSIQQADLIVAVSNYQSDEWTMKAMKACESAHPVFVFYLEGTKPSEHIAKCIAFHQKEWVRGKGDFPDQMEYSSLDQIAKYVADWFNSKNSSVAEHLPDRV